MDDCGSTPEKFQALTEAIGYRFSDIGMLQKALAHRSWCAENEGAESNERLEFLGDAVLGWVIADIVFDRFDEVPEGQLTDLRKSVVNASALADVAREIDLGRNILLGRGEAAADGADKESILSDAFEAVLGAVYLDGGASAAHGMVQRLVATRIPDTIGGLGQLDYKTRLQELCAQINREAPVYEMSSMGPDHAKTFRALALVDGEVLGEGDGRSKKAAEQIAAKEACANLLSRVRSN
jgi:ribonuclease-3